MSKLSNIDNDLPGYQQLAQLYHQHKNTQFSLIEVDMHRWFSANLTAALGGILDKLSLGSFNQIRFTHLDPNIRTILEKNNFLAYYGYPNTPDSHHTTIKYMKLKPSDGQFFNHYVVHQLLSRPELPLLSLALREKITEAIYEIFVNAQMHSNTEFIYTCGQFYPKKNRLEFTITDTGIGFMDKVNQRFSTNLSAIEAIKWAVQDRHTTKQNVTGGIGLALLRDFVKLNKGRMQIVSGQGYYEYGAAGEIARSMAYPFPGATINLQFCTDDLNQYALQSEIDLHNIF
jgi:hypothetical protein